MSQLRPQASTSNLHASPSLLSSPPSGKGSSAEDANSLGKSSSFSYTPYVSRSPRLMQQSDSLASFGTPPRDRSPSPYVPERDSLRDELMGVLMAFRACDPIDLTSKLHLGAQVHRLLIEGSLDMHVKDDFRDAGGFLIVVQMLSSLDQSVEARLGEEKASDDHENLRVEIYKLALTILREAIHHYPKNVATFQQTIGWASFAAVLRLSTVGQTSPERFFAGLLGLALGDVSSNLARLSTANLSEETGSEDEEAARVAEYWTGNIEHPGALVSLLTLLREEPVSHSLYVRILAVLERLANTSRRNQVRMARANVATMLLADQDDGDALAVKLARLRIIERLCQLGMPTQDCRLVLRRLDGDIGGPNLDFLQRIAAPSTMPNLITFDMTRYSHCSVAMSSLPRPFPPGPASKGFSFFAPVLIEKIEPSLALDLLHLFDSHRVCSVKLEIEPGTGQVSYSTLRDRPPIRFQQSRIVPGRMHHICLTHARPTGGAKSSLAQLYIDGQFVQEEWVQWPATPPNTSAMRAVFGTPPLEKVQKGGKNRLIWSMGPAYLLDDVLAPEIPLVVAELASTGYSGNFQDSLGRFLTYAISTRINLRLDGLARVNGASEKQLGQHPLVQVITDAARTIFREESFYFVLNSANHYDLDKISKRATSAHSTSVDRTQRPGRQLLLNQAVTLTKDAIETSYGYAKLFGSPVLAPTQSVADSIWKLGGCAVLLRLVQQSNSTTTLEKALTFMFDVLRNSWRLSEDVERTKGYEVLNYLVAQKKHFLTLRVLEIFCSAVGYSVNMPGEAALENPFLYRILLLDFSIWAQTSAEVREAHLHQFVVFLKTSKHRKFNAKRVAKMQITRKLLQALQLGRYGSEEEGDQDIPAKFLSTLRISLVSSFNDGAIRSVSTFLASQLCSPARTDPRRTPRRQQTLTESVLQTDLSMGLWTRPKQQTSSDRIEMAIRVFEMLTDLVLERPAFLLKLGSAVNIKWLLIFFGPTSEKRAASLGLEIMTALLIRDKRYADRLSRSGGFKVIERLLPRFWNYPRIFSRCWSTLFDIDEQPGTASLHSQFAPRNPQRIVCPAMLRLIVACIAAGFQALDEHVGKKREPLRSRPSDLLEANTKSRGTHGRQRSRSMNVDTTELVQAFQVTSELTLLKDNVRLMEEHAQQSIDFCDLLFASPLLRLLVSAITPYITLARERAEQGEVSHLASRLLTVLANAAVESITTSGSIQVVNAIAEAIPPDAGLSTATNVRLALFDEIASAVQRIIVPGLGDVLDDQVRRALSDFIEQCSGEVQNSRTLGLTANLLATFTDTRSSNSVVGALLTSLDRIILFRLAAGAWETYHEVIEHQHVIFMNANQDTAFFHCLLFNVISAIHRKTCTNHDGRETEEAEEELRMASYNVLILLAGARPAMVESIIVPEKTLQDFREASDVDLAAALLMGQGEDQVPFHSEWQGFTKSRDSLRAAVHLDRMSRVTQLLLSSDEKQMATSSAESKMVAWQTSVRESEENRLVKVGLDAKEMSKFGAGEWAKMLAELQRERAVLGKEVDDERIFELDPTEGPMRMRPKLKEMVRREVEEEGNRIESSEQTWMPISHGDEWASGEGMLEGEGEGAVEAPTPPPKQEDGPPSSIQEESAAVDTHDDKYRRVIRSLEKGDVIEGVENSLRVMFIECRASLLIFGKKCFYIIDDYFQRPDGELCNLWEAPEEERDTVVMSTLDGEGKGRQSLIEQLEGNAQQTRKWHWSELKLVALKTFLHRKTAIEIHFNDGQSCLLVLATAAKANNVHRNLASRNRPAAQAFASLADNLREATNSESGGFSRFAGAVLGRGAGSITQRWIDRKISNFDYLMCLNTAAGRTYQDITQYPVMPFVLRDYTSESLDLQDPNSFRDLALPMGAQNETRRRRFQERYLQLQELEDIDPDATKPFHYGTHYSTAATVSGYLIRVRPFDKILKALQGGTFDLADRTFNSIGQAYSSASQGSLGDVRELIPEAFYLPEFLTNSNRFEFGTTQAGILVDDVELPAWAKGDPRLFIKLHREALESDYVSMNLHSWIDLIFGCKQRGEAAVEATNCFHELSYDDGLDLQMIDSPVEQQAVLKTIHMFGVCPRKLFHHSHPQRRPREVQERPTIWQSPAMLTESIAPIRTLHASVHFIYAGNPARSFASPKDYLILPHLGLSLSVGHLDGSIRFFAKDNMNTVRNVVEQLMPDRISAIVDASRQGDQNEGRILVAGWDGTLTAWDVDGPRRDLTFVYSCRGHCDVVLCLQYSQAWNMAVSGSQDGTAIIWDSRGRFFKGLVHDGPVQIVCISHSTGLVATASGPTVRLWSINGTLIAVVSTSAKEHVASLAFLEQGDQEASEPQHNGLCMLFTGHRGKVIAWTCMPTTAEQQALGVQWALEPCHVLEHHDRLEVSTTPLITAIQAHERTIITGDELGRLFLWTLPGQAVEVPHNLSSTCMECGKKFGVFEKRLHCAACGGLFCNTCMDSLARFPHSRFCTHCRQRLQPSATLERA